MPIHVIGDSPAKLSAVKALIELELPTTSELLGQARIAGKTIDAIVVAADLRDVDNIAALKEISAKLGRISKRVFLIEQASRLSMVQAYALGATSVLSYPASAARLLKEIVEVGAAAESTAPSIVPASGGPEAAAGAGATCIAAMFAAVLSGSPINVEQAKNVGSQITESIAEHGLADWLATVRRHHEGTFQHCLLVTGVAVDFGLSLGMAKADIERLHAAAMFHDIGKAKIPLAVLDKPARLEAHERALIETHPVAGYEALLGRDGISPEVLDAVRHHHEYLDGSGYPDGLGAKSITDIVRILTISDIFAALIEYRSYKPTMARAQAYEILRGMQGKLEGPLVHAFREVALTR
jgi:putative nucleotidyltransferase with HDIG domain